MQPAKDEAKRARFLGGQVCGQGEARRGREAASPESHPLQRHTPYSQWLTRATNRVK